MSYYIFTALSKTGNTAAALNIMREYYGGMLKMGATTFWEDFSIDWMKNASPIDRLPLEGERDIHGDFGDHCYVGYRHSLCHGWSSGPVPYLMESILGISFAAPGGTEIRITPDLGDLTFAEGTYPLPAGGELWVRVEKSPEGYSIEYQAPDGISVTVTA